MNNTDNIICKICGKECLYLGSHIWYSHKIKSKEYKQQFGLDYKYPLISQTVREKKQKAFNERREYYMENLEKGKNYQFKPGHNGKYRVSTQSKKRILEQLEKIDSTGLCEICNMRFDHMQSHLYNKHGLIKITK